MSPDQYSKQEETEPEDLQRTPDRNVRFPIIELAPFRIFVLVVAIGMVLLGVLWVAETFGLLAALIPGGPTFFEGWWWAVLGLAGLVLLLVVVYGLRSAGD